MKRERTMEIVVLAIAVLSLIWAVAAWPGTSDAQRNPLFAPEGHYIWRDARTGCQYFVARNGGMEVRRDRDGTPFCEDFYHPQGER